MDDEILQLQMMLAEVQNTSTLNKLADRNVIEIINLLKSDYDLKLFYTIDGSEFFTPDKLDQCIIHTVIEHGKVSLGDLHNYLLIGQETIDSRVNSFLRKSDITLVDGVLMSSNYLEMICDEINESLQVKDELAFLDLSANYGFSTEFLKGEIIKRLDTTIDGVVSPDGKRLMTKGYLQIINSKVRGVTRSQQAPTLISKLAERISTDASKFEDLLQKLIIEGQVAGEIKKGFFIPKKYADQTEHILRSIFERKGALEYSWVESKFGVKSAKHYLSFLGEKAIMLDESAISSDKLEEAKITIDQGLEEDGYVNIFDSFPSSLRADEIESILKNQFNLKHIVIEEDIIIAESLLKRCLNSLDESILNHIETNPEIIDKMVKILKEVAEKEKKSTKKNKSKDLILEYPVHKKEIIEELVSKKIIEYINEEEIEEAIFKNLITQVNKKYSDYVVNIAKAKSEHNSNMIEKETLRVAHLLDSLAYANKSIEKLVTGDFSVDENILEEIGLDCAEIVLDAAVFLISKKYNTSIDSKHLRKLSLVQISTASKFKKLVQQRFIDIEAIKEVIKGFPKDLKDIFGQLVTLIVSRSLPNICAFLEENAVGMSLPNFSWNPKKEKIFYHAHKYFVEEEIDPHHTQPFETISHLITLVGMGKGIFFWPKDSREDVSKTVKKYITIISSLKEFLGTNQTLRLEEAVKLADDPESSKNGLSDTLKELCKLIK